MNTYAYLPELHVLKLYLKYVRENSIDNSYIACATQPWTWPPTGRHEYTCDKNSIQNLEHNRINNKFL